MRRLDLTADTRRRRQPQPARHRPAGLDRLDVYVDGRPRGSSDVTDGETMLTFADVGAATTLQVQGFADGELVAARTQQL